MRKRKFVNRKKENQSADNVPQNCAKTIWHHRKWCDQKTEKHTIMIAIKKQIWILRENISLLQGIVKYILENQIVVVTAGSSFVFAVRRECGNNDVNRKYNSIVRNDF